MVKTAFLFLVAALQAAAPQDRLAPLLERWRSTREDDRLQALRDAAALRKDTGDAPLARFAQPPLPKSWARLDDLIDLLTREHVPSWSAILVPLLQDPDIKVAWQAAYALIQLEARDRIPEIAALLKAPDGSLRPNVVHILMKLGTKEHGPLVAPLLDDPDPEVAIAAVDALGQFRARDYAGRVVKFLESSNPSHRQSAVAALAAMGARDRADKIAERLSDAQVLVRWEAIRALGRLKAKEYAGQIVASVDDDGGQAPGLEAMGALGLRELAPHILPFLVIPDPGIRWRAVRALGDVDAKDDADRVAEMLKDEDSFVRLCSLQALAAMGSRRHTGEMVALLRDEEFDVCRGAADEASAMVTPDQIKTVSALLGDEDSVTRWHALRLLVAAGAKSSLPAIAAKLKTGGTVNWDVVWAIGRLDGREQRDAVAEALRSEDPIVRREAAFALSRLTDRTEELEAAEKSSTGAARLAASIGLLRLGKKDKAAASALIRDYVVHREEPEYQRVPDELLDALAAAFEKDATAALARELKVEKRIDTLKDLEALLSKAGVTLAPEGTPELKRRLPAGTTLTARRALEWSFGSDARIVPGKGGLSILDAGPALDAWQKRLESP